MAEQTETETEPEVRDGEPRPGSDPRFDAARNAGQGERGRELLEHVRQGAELDPKEESDALDWLLGVPKPIIHRIPVDVETETGMATLEFVVPRIDVRRIDAIELRNVNQNTGRIDRLTADFEIVADMAKEMRSAGGRVVSMTDERFMTVRMHNTQSGQVEDVKLASPAEALEKRLVGQEGVITLVAAEIRRLSGYDQSRLGTSTRALTEASLG